MPDPTLASSFPTSPTWFSTTAVPQDLRPGFILSCASFLSRVSRATTAPSVQLGAPSMGFRSPSRRHRWSPLDDGFFWKPAYRGRPKPASFRPRRFSRPRRLAPPAALWVCFTPQPRPGFTLQGLPPTRSCTDSSSAGALMSLTLASCTQLPKCAGNSCSPTGPCSPRGSVVRRGGLCHASLDPLLSFSSFGFFSVDRRSVFTSPSDRGFSHPSSCCPSTA